MEKNSKLSIFTIRLVVAEVLTLFAMLFFDADIVGLVFWFLATLIINLVFTAIHLAERQNYFLLLIIFLIAVPIVPVLILFAGISRIQC